jgi:drug/metabolite transporter (DMT)-like permease
MHLRGNGYAITASLMFGLGVVLAKLLSGEINAVLGGIIVSLSDRKPGPIALTTVTPLQEEPVKEHVPLDS